MASFRSVPLNDIQILLTSYNQKIYNSDDIYIDCLNFIMDNWDHVILPESIKDWFQAQHSHHQTSQLNIYSSGDVLLSSDNQLASLTHDLNFETIDKHRIIRTLNYINKLHYDVNIFDMLPVELFIYGK